MRLRRIGGMGLGFLVLTLGAVVLTYETVPTHSANRSMTSPESMQFDTILVLGSPADPDGKPSPEQRERVLEGVREFKAGRARHLIVSGGAVHNQWIEAEVMARLAEASGVPADDVVEERQARNTIENVFYAQRIMHDKGWTSVEVVSSPSHLPRTGLILQHYGFAWRTQAARWPKEYEWQRIAPYYLYEAAGTTVLRWFGFRKTAFISGKVPL